jgi:glycosyltransferase involved in cell wall biosynthesis/GT2 family glycosyltransferase
MQKDDFVVRKFPDLSAFDCAGEGRPLRVCIATEEIVGPIKNGGIATTYYHLARMLQELGHEVTVLYLKGDRVAEKTTDHWIKWYEQLGIKFVPLPLESISQRGFSTFWQQRYYAFYRWLSDQPVFDVVHTSEWRGGAMYVLGAKRLGLGFADTLFLVKASSPHIWNRHYQMRTIQSDDLTACSYAEQKTIEWADIVIGGSAHLLSFMERMGYAMPEGRMYVQPNVIDFEGMDIPDQRPAYQYGEIVKSDELVFFGRLEARKGLEIFCDAVDRLVFQGVVPKKLYFMGKQGQRLPNNPDITTIEFIKLRARQWPFDVVIKDSFGPQQAIGFLCEKPRLAVMPSLIENSTMAVYEALVHRIPFLATDVGGTAELIHPRYHEATLTEARSDVLAKDLARLITDGGVIAESAFQPDDNLAVWRRFHTYLSSKISQGSVRDVIAEMSYDASALADAGRVSRPFVPALGEVEELPNARISLIVYHTDDIDGLELSLRAIQAQDTAFDEVILIVDGHVSKDSTDEYARLKQTLEADGVRVIETEHQCLAESYNQAAAMATHDVLVFLHAGIHVPQPTMALILKTAFAHEHVEATVSVYDIVDIRDSDQPSRRHRYLPVGGDIAAHMIHDGALGGDCFAVRAAVFKRLGGFYSSYHVSGVQAAFQTKLVCDGVDLRVIPEVLYEQYKGHQTLKYNERSGQYLRIKPLLDTASPAMRRFFLRVGEHVHMKTGNHTTCDFKTIVNGDPRSLGTEMIGVALDQTEGIFHAFMRASESDAGKQIHVMINGEPMAQLSLATLGDSYRVCAWELEAGDLTRALNHLVFKCLKGGRVEVMRRLNLVVSYDDIVYVVSRAPVIMGAGDIGTARMALPMGSPVDRITRRAKMVAKAMLRR